MAAHSLHRAWPVAAIAVVAVARSCSHEEAGLSSRDRKLSVTHTEARAEPNHEQEHQGQSCDLSYHHAIDLNLNFGPMNLEIKGFSIKISAQPSFP